jgi:hypothetical protein
MDMRIRCFGRIVIFLMIAGLAGAGGCAHKTQALFTQPELITRGRLAVLGLTPEQDQIFMATYTRAFPGQIIRFVERSQLRGILSEQDLLRGRLDDRARARINKILDVEAVIICTYYDADAGKGTKKLSVRIVDCSNGTIVGSVITEGRDNFGYHCDRAVKAIKADLLSGSR